MDCIVGASLQHDTRIVARFLRKRLKYELLADVSDGLRPAVFHLHQYERIVLVADIVFSLAGKGDGAAGC